MTGEEWCALILLLQWQRTVAQGGSSCLAGVRPRGADRHGWWRVAPLQAGAVRRYQCRRRQRWPLLHRKRHGAVAASQPRRQRPRGPADLGTGPRHLSPTAWPRRPTSCSWAPRRA